MSAVQRANPFAGLGGDLDLEGLAPTPKAARPKVDKAATRAAAERLDFSSREPVPAAPGAAPAEPEPAPRRGRLQRRAPVRREQFNLRADSATIERFAAIAEAKGWLLAETFEQAVRALEEKLAS